MSRVGMRMEINLERASVLWAVSWWPSGPETGQIIQYQLLSGEDFLMTFRE